MFTQKTCGFNRDFFTWLLCWWLSVLGRKLWMNVPIKKKTNSLYVNYWWNWLNVCWNNPTHAGWAEWWPEVYFSMIPFKWIEHSLARHEYNIVCIFFQKPGILGESPLAALQQNPGLGGPPQPGKGLLGNSPSGIFKFWKPCRVLYLLPYPTVLPAQSPSAHHNSWVPHTLLYMSYILYSPSIHPCSKLVPDIQT